MQEFSERIAAERARWLGELAAALEEARRLTKELGAGDGQQEATALYVRIERVRVEIEAMRLRRSVRLRPENDPEWSMLWNAPSRCG